MKPHCDTTTGKIYGCEKGTLEYYHEEGHVEFNNSDEGSWMLMVKSYVFDAWMVTVVFTIGFTQNPLIHDVAFLSSVVLLSSYTFITFYEEHWCNKYAKQKMDVENGN